MKELLKKTVSVISPLFSIHSLIKISGQGLILPFYHVVSDNDLPHVKHLYPVTSVKRFNEDIDFFVTNYKATNFEHLIKCVNNERLRKEKVFFLSFDDGLREFHDVVAPILIEKGIPAACFVNPAYVDNKDIFYRLKFSILAEIIKTKGISRGQENKIKEIFASHGLLYTTGDDLFRVKNVQKSIAEEIAPILEIDFKDYLDKNKPYLTLSQIQNLIEKGFTIGAHSMTHAYFPDLSVENQITEATESLRWIKERLNQKISLFSFPYTDFQIKKTFFDKLEKQVDLTFGTANLKLDAQKTNFQRIPMEIPNSRNAEQILKSEYIYFILKMLVNKHIISRD
jgi:peptidoglycan/xylan/chitin deacetylase (PgdA/CDA1 family)